MFIFGSRQTGDAVGGGVTPKKTFLESQHVFYPRKQGDAAGGGRSGPQEAFSSPQRIFLFADIFPFPGHGIGVIG